MSLHCLFCLLHYNVALLCRAIVATYLVSLYLGGRIGTDTGYAGFRRVESTVSCEERTHSVVKSRPSYGVVREYIIRALMDSRSSNTVIRCEVISKNKRVFELYTNFLHHRRMLQFRK